jgi:predicted phosphodiesterase
MTRPAILSDVHGNLPALEAVRQDLSQFRANQLIVAGGLVNVGPFSAQVVERIVESGWVVIRGNGELFLLDHGTPRSPDRWNDPTGFAMLPWLAHQVSDTWKQAIAT